MRSIHCESMATYPCVDCAEPVDLPDPHGDATCQKCGLAMFVNEDGQNRPVPDSPPCRQLRPATHRAALTPRLDRTPLA
jgi:DNA-directed RNA polymerase subunit RPC12/RpoP